MEKKKKKKTRSPFSSDLYGSEQERAQAAMAKFDAEATMSDKPYINKLADWLRSGQVIIKVRKARRTNVEWAQWDNQYALIAAINLLKLAGRENEVR